MKPILLTKEPTARFAFRFIPAIVRALVPPGIIGCYVLMIGDSPVYVGRSDSCLRQRLSRHGHIGFATHFLWQPCKNPVAAFNLESLWYHHLRHDLGRNLLNTIHPDSPSGANRSCPFCVPADRDALAFALERQRN